MLLSTKMRIVKKNFLQFCFVAILLVGYILAINLSGVQGIPGFVGPLLVKMDVHPLNIYIIFPLLLFIVFIFLFNKISETLYRKSIFLILSFFILFAFLFNISVAMIDGGISMLGQPFTRTSLEYYGDIAKIGNPLVFLENYVSLMPSLAMHAQSRPPGPILFLWLGSQVFGAGLLKSALWVIFISSLSVIPLYLLTKDICGQKASIYSLALYAFTPSVVLYTATSITAVNAFFILTSTYLFFKAMTTRGLFYPILSGISLAASIFMTFFEHGVIIIFFAIIAFYHLKKHSNIKEYFFRIGTVAVTFCSFYILLFVSTGFNIIQCVITAYNMLAQQAKDSPGQNSYLYWFLGKPVAFFLFIGIPVTTLYFKELYKIVRKYVKKFYVNDLDVYGVFVVASILILFVSDLPALKGEVERTWLSLVPFIIIPAAKNLSDLIVWGKTTMPLYMTLVLLFLQVVIFESIFYTSW